MRRVLGYVVPNPVVKGTKPDDRTATHSALAVAADALSRLPRVQSIGRELEDIEASNDKVRERRLTREETLVHDAATLTTAAARLLPAYARIRGLGAADQIVAILLSGRAPVSRLRSRSPPSGARCRRSLTRPGPRRCRTTT